MAESKVPGGRYSGGAILLHWLTVAALLVQIPAGLTMVRVGRPLQDWLFILHKGLGSLLILIVLARILWRLTHRPPPLEGIISPGRARLAEAVHLGLYVMLVVMVVSGYTFTVAGGFPIELLNALGVPPLLAKHEALSKAALLVHLTGIWVILALILLHVAGALDHALIKRDGLIRRMLP
jgi:cytochrome b561